MNWVAGLLGAACLLLGVLLGLLISAHRRRDRQVDQLVAPQHRPAVVVPEGTSQVLAVIRSAGVVVGPHDEVLESTPLALKLGLTRGSRVVIAQVLEMVRLCRREDRMLSEEVNVSRGGSGRSDADLLLGVRVAPMSGGLVVVLADDLTDARRVEAIRRDFVANVSHELKTPIGAVSLLAEAVEEAADDPEAVRRFAARMGIESTRLADLVSQIIDLSRLQATDPMGRADTVEIDDVLIEAVDRCRVDAEEREVTITVAGENGLQVMGDQQQLTTAIGNLVENALVYSDPGARVVVAARRQVRDDDYVAITVSDNGIGIPTDQLERIFERFYRVDYARSRANGGSGLGLSIVKHIAAVHHGDVAVWSQLGQGSTFTLRLPAQHDHDSEQDHDQDPDRDGAAVTSLSARAKTRS
ncbi:two-component histidine kinase SenX3 [Microlunatus phosphovorus NM-1]|uniref:Sensor-like histidine kinase SenX3 n=1 Tax=Microlunatus phosphovorus (strain ATCC 700054 / DSM 10555 / JCM 9379 / NBRC 101784 / NCIMB 13414 / VKM Ac-1990 / NM-1) TaxID=1032480 RepID=F5XF11_MICPN|nr:ATP-binding protein [Microlunatus phosphovorus]BAK37749.1 two-component histidine kinase SenX3 [Microlunatus phosphovorus NM-1]